MNKNEFMISVLKQIITAKIKTSGNLEHKLNNLGLEISQELADSYYEENAKEEEVFEKGLALGIEADDNDSIYRIEIEDNILYYIGTEADIIRKITEREEELLEDAGADKDVSIEV